MAEKKQTSAQAELTEETMTDSKVETTTENENIETKTETAENESTETKKDTKKKDKKPKKESESKGGLKALLRSRKLRHGSLAVVFTAVAAAVVILVNIVAGLLVDRFPDLKADFTANKAFALSDDTRDYMSHLSKDIKFYIISKEDDFVNTDSYFVQAKNLLDKMKSTSDGKFTFEFVDTTENPQFTQQFPNVDWKSKSVLGVVACGEQYKALEVKDCFTYNEDYYNYYGVYEWTGTTIEQAIVKSALNVTTNDKVIVDVLTGEGEVSENGYGGLSSLMSDNAYQVNEVSLLTGELDKDARVVLLYAPATDLSDEAAEALRTWLENDGKYGKTLIYAANVDPTVTPVKTPNIDAILSDWGMEVNSGIVYDTDPNHMLNNAPLYTFILDYNKEYYMDNLKNSSIPVLNEMASGITIKDANTAHALLQTSDKAGIVPLDATSDFDINAHVTGEPIAIAAEGKKAGTETYSNVIVFSTKAMLVAHKLSYASFKNGAYFMNMLNTITEKEDNTVVIESKNMESATLGAPSSETSNAVMVVFMFVIPGLILAAGIVLWIIRRNR